MALLIIAGASGCGKKFVLDKLKALLMPAKDIKKLTSLPTPAHKKNDLIYDQERTFIKQECKDFCYEYDGHLYGIPKKEIDESLSSENNTIIIVRDFEVIKKLEAVYKRAMKVYVFTGPSGDELSNRLKKLKMTY